MWVTAAIFMDWFHNCFIPQLERYLAERNLSKVLLLEDNAPLHPEVMMVAHPNVNVILLPHNTTSPIQPLDQGLISTFKTYYTSHTFCRILHATESNPELTVRKCWKDFNTAHCISAIKDSLDKVKASTINACWQNL